MDLLIIFVRGGIMKALMCFLTIFLTVSLCSAQTNIRGDFNGDGLEPWNLGDAIYLFNYLFDGGPPPPNPEYDSLDVDCYHLLTISDANLTFQCVPSCDFPPECPVINPPLYPESDPGSQLYYTNRLRPDSSSGRLRLHLTLFNNYGAFSLPLRIRVDGQVPTIDSVIFPIYADLNACFTDEANGEFALGAMKLFGWGLTALDIADVYFSVPPSPSEQSVTLEWTTMNPVQAPTPDGSVYPMLTNASWFDATPVLHPTCCITPGDVNDDGEVNVADAVYMIVYVFLYGPPPPCPAQADPNCDGATNVGDAIYLISYIFKGGPAPGPCPCW
jgi:hypothetical protein